MLLTWLVRSHAHTLHREGQLVAAKLQRMLERKIDLWDPEEVFELMPTLMKVHMDRLNESDAAQ